jgi:hypothetical protein
MTQPSLRVIASNFITLTKKSDLASFGIFSAHAKNIELRGFLNEPKLLLFLLDPERT